MAERVYFLLDDVRHYQHTYAADVLRLPAERVEVEVDEWRSQLDYA